MVRGPRLLGQNECSLRILMDDVLLCVELAKLNVIRAKNIPNWQFCEFFESFVIKSFLIRSRRACRRILGGIGYFRSLLSQESNQVIVRCEGVWRSLGVCARCCHYPTRFALASLTIVGRIWSRTNDTKFELSAYRLCVVSCWELALFRLNLSGRIRRIIPCTLWPETKWQLVNVRSLGNWCHLSFSNPLFW